MKAQIHMSVEKKRLTDGGMEFNGTDTEHCAVSSTHRDSKGLLPSK